MGDTIIQSKLAIDPFFLRERIRESRGFVEELARRSQQPLVVMFSGGRDSMAVLGVVKEVTDRFVCAYMATGLEFKGVVDFVKQTCRKLGVQLFISHPGLHKGNIFKRIEGFHTFPNIGSGGEHSNNLWCCRDLKLRPMKKLLARELGKGPFYKLEGIRLSESSRRKYIYREVAETMLREDGEHKGSYEAFPILRWTDEDVVNYLEARGLSTSGLYEQYGVSGCSWCPFYGPEIYRRVLRAEPHHYDRFIAVEERLNLPSVVGRVFLRDLKNEVVLGIPLPEAEEGCKTKRPCTMMFEGREVPTCQVYGHLYIDGVCYRCGLPQR